MTSPHRLTPRLPVICGVLILFVFAHEHVYVSAVKTTMKYNCDPCLDRSQYFVRGFVHGSASAASSSFWKLGQASAVQAGEDMGVKFEIKVYEDFELDKMAADIFEATVGSSQPDALVVNIPSNSSVREAVKKAVSSGMPVFGFNTGYELAHSLGILGWIGMDDYLAGEYAAKEFQELMAPISKTLFINPDKHNSAYNRRWEGFNNKLSASNFSEIYSSTGYDMDFVFEECPYDAVLIAENHFVQPAISASEKHGCNGTVIGTFGTSKFVYDALADETVSFAISEQQYLQGGISVLLASLYVTTGNVLKFSSQTNSGMYLSGPLIIKKDGVPCKQKHCDLPSDTMQACEEEAFPVCPLNKSPVVASELNCDCTDRSKIRIAGVTHGVTTDPFWDVVFAASEQAANDFEVDLIFRQFDPEQQESILHQKMANEIRSLCENNVDGIFVSIPSNAVKDAIQSCLDYDIPVVSINSGISTSMEMGLIHHIGQFDYNAGYAGGEMMVKLVDVETGYCLNHAFGVSVLQERCNGFRDALQDRNVSYGGEIVVPADNHALYRKMVEDAVGSTSGDWQRIGFLAAGQPNHIPALKVRKNHPKMILGAIDVSNELFDALDGDTVLFGIDQNAYLQGYLPVPLLTYLAYTFQHMDTQVIETGPNFITDVPSNKEKECRAKHFEVCANSSPGDGLLVTEGGRSEQTQTGLIITIAILGFVVVFAIGFLSYRLIQLQKYLEKLENQGREVPKLSAGKKLSSIYKPVDLVVKASS